MANLSQQKRQRMMEFLSMLKEEHKDDDSVLIALGEIEAELNAKKYGLVWEEHEEAVDVKMKNNIPVFTECKDKEINASDSGTYNFLLEGDNLHSLYLLEKTHKGRVDIIYIDPPYNRGKDDFVYDDNYVGAEDTYKHSKWLSFMEKRLRIAYNLLSEDGMIFFLRVILLSFCRGLRRKAAKQQVLFQKIMIMFSFTLSKTRIFLLWKSILTLHFSMRTNGYLKEENISSTRHWIMTVSLIVQA